MKAYRKPKSEKDLTACLARYNRLRDDRIENSSLIMKRLRRLVS